MYYSFIPFLVIFFSINEILSILFKFSSFFTRIPTTPSSENVAPSTLTLYERSSGGDHVCPWTAEPEDVGEF